MTFHCILILDGISHLVGFQIVIYREFLHIFLETVPITTGTTSFFPMVDMGTVSDIIGSKYNSI